MAKKPIEIDVLLNAEDSIQKAKELKKALRDIPVGTAEYDKVFNAIDDLDDKLKGAKKGASDWIDTLEGAGGPLGLLGGAINKAKVSFGSFNTALKTSVIGIVVSLIGGLVAAFSKTDGSMKKLQPVLIQFERIFAGIVEALQPVIDMLVELADFAMPYVTKGFKVAYSAMSSFLQGIGLIGKAISKLFSGDFSGAWETAKEAVTGFSDRYEEASEAFDRGASRMTKTEKENAGERTKAREEELDAAKKIADAKLEKDKQTALAAAKTDEERFNIEKQYQEKTFNQELDYLNKKSKLYGKNSKERKDIEAQIIKLEADRIAQQTENAKKEKEFRDAETAKKLEAIKQAGEQEVQTQQKIFELKKELYGAESMEAEVAAQNVINSRRKAAEEEIKFFDDIVKAGGTLTEEQKKRQGELKQIQTQIVLDQNKLDLDIVRNAAKRNEKLNDEEVNRLKKLAENERLGYDIRISALKRLQEELLRDKQIKDAAIEEEAAKRIKQGEDEVAVAKWVAEQKKLIEQGYAEQVQPLITSTSDLTKKKNDESFQSFLQLGTAISQASSLFKEGSDAAKAFAAVQDLVNIAQQANIVITNLQALGILQKASAEGVATTATMGHAAAEGTKQGAKLPFPANIVAIASIVAAVISIFATIKKLFGAKGSVNTTAAANQGAGERTAPAPYRVVANRAQGGIVMGQGTSTSDSILTAVSNGEYVMNAKSTERFLPILNRMNEVGRMPQFQNAGFASPQVWRQNDIMEKNTTTGLELAPIRTYVVGQDMSNQQQFDRTIKSRSLL